MRKNRIKYAVAAVILCLSVVLSSCSLIERRINEFTASYPADGIFNVTSADESDSGGKYYYRSLLDGDELTAYDLLYENMLLMGREFKIPPIGSDNLDKVVNCVLLDHPEIFYWDGYTYMPVPEYISVKPNYPYTNGEIVSMRNKIALLANEIISGIDSSATEFDKALSIHDWIVSNCDYDSTVTDSSVLSPAHTIYGVLINGKAVCAGYAYTFDYLCSIAGIDTFSVCGTGIEDGTEISHQWNIINLGGNYYQTDVTWDDPVFEDETSIKSYRYFNLTDDEMKNDHRMDENFVYPECVSDEYNFYKKNGLVSSGGDIAEAFLNALDYYTLADSENKSEQIDVTIKFDGDYEGYAAEGQKLLEGNSELIVSLLRRHNVRCPDRTLVTDSFSYMIGKENFPYLAVIVSRTA